MKLFFQIIRILFYLSLFTLNTQVNSLDSKTKNSYSYPLIAEALADEVFEKDDNKPIWSIEQVRAHVDNSNVQIITPVSPQEMTENIDDTTEYFNFPQGMIVASPLETDTEDDLDDEEERGYVINFDNVGIIEYLRWISNITHTNFIFDENELNFNITIISKEPATTSVIMASLLQVLRIHNLTLMEQGNNIIIYSAGQGQNSSTTVVLGEEESNLEANALVTKMFRLKNAQPAHIQKIIVPLLSQNALVEVSEETHHIIITDLAINIDKVEQLLQTLDKPNTNLDIGIYYVKNINIQTLVNLAQQIVVPLADTNPLLIVPQSSTDTVFIISTPYLIEKTASVMRTLDVNTGGLNETQRIENLPDNHIDRTLFKVHKLKYHQGSEIQTSLRKIGNTLANTGIANAGLVSTINTLEWLEATNSLVFSGDPDSIAKINELINTLDIPKREVFIEMLVIETSVLKSLSIGVDFAADISGNKGDLIGGFGGSRLSSVLKAASTGSSTASTTMIDKLGSGFTMGAIGKGIKLGSNYYTSLAAVVDALQSDSETSIIMNPQIVTESAHAAELFVGVTDRFQSSSIQGTEGTTTVTNYEYRKIGSRLIVTPTIGNSNIVTLDIDQTIENNLGVSDSGSSGDSGTPVPVISTKSTRTRVHVPDQHFLILSGMISEEKQKKHNKVPCLGSAPILSSVLGHVQSSYNKRNIMIFIRPQIINTAAELEAVSSKQKNLLQEEWKSQDVNFQLNGLLDWLELNDKE